MNSFPKKNDNICKDAFNLSLPFLNDLAKGLKLENITKNYYEEVVVPLSAYISNFPKRDQPYLICLSGGQGSGKTTLSHFLQVVLQEAFTRISVGFSIDDLYKTKEERKQLASTVHPLCEVRGVPGTHNVKLGLDTLNSLYQASENTLTPIPSFSKPLDKHYPKQDWPNFKGRPEFVFFDAWCGGAKPISEEDWKPPLNDLERQEDPHGIWSKWSNRELAGDYQKLFSLIDLLILIKVPNMQYVYESRWLQEQTLLKTLKEDDLKKRIMTKKQVYRFVMHYERLTHYILEEMPSFADIVLSRDGKFNFSFDIEGMHALEIRNS